MSEETNNHDIDWAFVNAMHKKWVEDHPDGAPAVWWSI